MPAKATLLAMTLCLGGVMAAPANAAAASPQSICGSGFRIAPGGAQPVKTVHGRQYGTVYLLYNAATGENCVVTVKSSFVGMKSPVSATLTVKVKGAKKTPIVRTDSGNYKSYAGPVKQWAKNTCVKFWGSIKPANGHDPQAATGGRNTWGNCGD